MNTYMEMFFRSLIANMNQTIEGAYQDAMKLPDAKRRVRAEHGIKFINDEYVNLMSSISHDYAKSGNKTAMDGYVSELEHRSLPNSICVDIMALASYMLELGYDPYNIKSYGKEEHHIRIKTADGTQKWITPIQYFSSNAIEAQRFKDAWNSLTDRVKIVMETGENGGFSNVGEYKTFLMKRFESVFADDGDVLGKIKAVIG